VRTISKRTKYALGALCALARDARIPLKFLEARLPDWKGRGRVERTVMREVRDAVASIPDTTTLRDVVSRVEAAQAASQTGGSALMYSI
jgi:DNA-binding IscR family transcriptional regulator